MKEPGSRRHDRQNLQWEHYLLYKVRVLQNERRTTKNDLSEQVEQIQAAKESEPKLKRTLIGTVSEAGLENKSEHEHVNCQHDQWGEKRPEQSKERSLVTNGNVPLEELPEQVTMTHKIPSHSLENCLRADKTQLPKHRRFRHKRPNIMQRELLATGFL